MNAGAATSKAERNEAVYQCQQQMQISWSFYILSTLPFQMATEYSTFSNISLLAHFCAVSSCQWTFIRRVPSHSSCIATNSGIHHRLHIIDMFCEGRTCPLSKNDCQCLVHEVLSDILCYQFRTYVRIRAVHISLVVWRTAWDLLHSTETARWKISCLLFTLLMGCGRHAFWCMKGILVECPC